MGERVGARVDLGVAERPELVDDHRVVRVARRERDRAGGRAAAPALQRPQEVPQPVRPHRPDHAGVREHLDVAELVRHLPGQPPDEVAQLMGPLILVIVRPGLYDLGAASAADPPRALRPPGGGRSSPARASSTQARRLLDLVRLARGQILQEGARARSAQLLRHRPLSGLDHSLAALAVHPVAAHHSPVLRRRLDHEDLAAEAAQLALLVREPAPAAAVREHRQQVEQALLLVRARQRVEADDEVEPAPRHEVEVRDRADAAVHVAPPVDPDRPVEARDRTGRRDRLGDVRARSIDPPERDAPARW